VPIVTVTLWSDDPSVGAFEPGQVAHCARAELKRVPGTRDITPSAPRGRAVRVLLDPQALAGHGIGLDDLRRTLQTANSTHDDIKVTKDNAELLIQAGTSSPMPSRLATRRGAAQRPARVPARRRRGPAGPELPTSYA